MGVDEEAAADAALPSSSSDMMEHFRDRLMYVVKRALEDSNTQQVSIQRQEMKHPLRGFSGLGFYADKHCVLPFGVCVRVCRYCIFGSTIVSGVEQIILLGMICSITLSDQ